MKKRNPVLHGALMVFFAGVLWGFSGCCGQLLSQKYGVPVEWVVAERMEWSGFFFLVVGLIMNRKNMVALVRDRPSCIRMIIYGALGVLCNSWFYLEAISWTNAGTGTLMEQLGLLLVVGITCIRERRAPKLLEIIGLVLALTGVFLVCTHGNPTVLVLSREGFWWGMAAALGVAFYITLPVTLLKTWDSFTVTSCGMIVAGILCTIVFHPWTYQVALTLPVVAAMAGMIICGTILGYLFFLEGVKYAGPVLAGLLDTVELVLSYVISVLWLGVQLSAWDLAGCLCILGMMVLVTLKDVRRHPTALSDARRDQG